MRLKLKSGKVKEYEEMTNEEKDECEREFQKGLVISAGVLGGLHLLSK